MHHLHHHFQKQYVCARETHTITNPTPCVCFVHIFFKLMVQMVQMVKRLKSLKKKCTIRKK